MSDCMSHFRVKLAGVSIEVETPSLKLTPLLSQYRTDEDPTISVSVNQDDIDSLILSEKKFGKNNEDRYLTDKSHHLRLFYNEVNVPYLESMAIYMKIAHRLLEHNILLMHGAVVAIDDCGVMFCAPSGTGKTTHARLWLNRLDDAYMVNGDKPLVRIDEGRVMAYGTPWCGKECLGDNVSVPLCAIVLMERSDFNSIQEVEPVKAFPFLIQQTYMQKTKESVKQTLLLLRQLYESVPIYLFRFNNFEDDCFDVVYGKLSKMIHRS